MDGYILCIFTASFSASSYESILHTLYIYTRAKYIFCYTSYTSYTPPLHKYAAKAIPSGAVV